MQIQGALKKFWASIYWTKNFHWCTECGTYCCLICRGRKLLGWPSYVSVSAQ